jgi:hypothetical protein
MEINMVGKIATAFVGATLAALPVAGMAAENGKRPAFGEVDTDGNGKISMEEAKQAGVPSSEAKREDIDNDGKLTKADWKFVDLEKKQESNS